MSQPNPPVAAIRPKKLEKHGHIRIDNYYWLRERESEEVLDYLTDNRDFVFEYVI